MITSKLSQLPAPGVHPGPAGKPAPKPELPQDHYEEAAQDKGQPHQHKLAKSLLGLGMLAGGLGTSAHALAADQAQVQIQTPTQPLAGDDV
ncbi:MAG: hypothetical protein U0931_32350, partial [Vulcanimicrobiota bacterium]